MKKDLLHRLLALKINLKNVDGGLKVNAPKGVLTKSLIAEINEHKPYLLKLLGSNIKIPKAIEVADYALSPTQYSLWFIHLKMYFVLMKQRKSILVSLIVFNVTKLNIILGSCY